jgi:serine/threonine protein kinase
MPNMLCPQICLAMHHVHTAGVLHRDLKTSNILATKPSGAATPGSSTPTIASRRASTSAPGHGHSSSEVPAATAAEFDSLPLLKLADFGVAKAGCNTEGSMVGTTVGTPHYLSPEMCDGKRYGKKTDVWALGCILYEIACLNKAFEASNIGGVCIPTSLVHQQDTLCAGSAHTIV